MVEPFCAKCGEPIRPGQHYCLECGAKLDEERPTKEVTPMLSKPIGSSAEATRPKSVQPPKAVVASSQSIKEVADQDEMQRVINDFMTRGYTIKERGTQTTLLKKKLMGPGFIASLIVGIIIAIFTVGLGLLIPVAYVIYAHYNASEVLVRVR